MPIFGIDISHHQGSFDVERAAREGIDFFIFKATEGDGFTDARFSENVAKARKTKKPFAAYHYQRSGISAAAQVAHVKNVVSTDIPVIPDVETNSGGVSLTRDIVSRLRSAGYSVPLLYMPRWYWQQLGSPSLSGLPPLWSSRYPDNKVGDIRDEYAAVPAHYWNGYGGLRVEVLQFTSSARVAGRAPIDGNAYRGTLAQLRALFGSTGGGGAAGGGNMALSIQDLRDVEVRSYRAAANVLADAANPDTHAHKRMRALRSVLGIDQIIALIGQQHGVSAEEIADALAPQLSAALLPTIETAVEKVLGADNRDQAEEIVAELARVLATNTEEQSSE